MWNTKKPDRIGYLWVLLGTQPLTIIYWDGEVASFYGNHSYHTWESLEKRYGAKNVKWLYIPYPLERYA